MNETPLTVYVDGSYKAENGLRYAGFGFIIYEGEHHVSSNGLVVGEKTGEVRRESGGVLLPENLGRSHHNYAELYALREALDCLIYWGWHHRHIQVLHDATLDPRKTNELHTASLVDSFDSITFKWISRRKNGIADHLAVMGRRQLMEKIANDPINGRWPKIEGLS
jgi:ribonuclease HI